MKLKMIMTTLLISTVALASEVKPEKAISDAIKFYRTINGIDNKSYFETILRINKGIDEIENTKYQVVLALARHGTMGALGDWELRTVKILELEYTKNGNQIKSNDITIKGLPEGIFDACYWTKNRDSDTSGGRSCFPIEKLEDKIWIRLWAMGIARHRIPWRKPNGKVIYTEMAPEECDGGFDDQEHALGWCPWSAKYQGIFKNESHAEPQFSLP